MSKLLSALGMCCAMLLGTNFVWGQDGAANADETPAIHACIEAYVAAYNAGDAKALANCWAENAVYVARDTGAQIRGRDAIEKMFTDEFSEDAQSKLSVNVDSLRFVSDSVAIEDGTANVTSPDGSKEETSYTAVHVKTPEGWKLDSVRETVGAKSDAQDASNQNLSALEWMIGEWVDQSDESTVETTCRWTKNKTFMTRSFKVSAPGMDDLEGTQVVGWDPINSTIRSWLFDSDGGFLEGIWTEKNGGWEVKSSGFLADGRSASSMNVFTPVDDNTFIWKALGRQVDGQYLPNIEDVKVVRKAATDVSASATEEATAATGEN
jgi:uncharacterized protein (TIGR02246 family)